MGIHEPVTLAAQAASINHHLSGNMADVASIASVARLRTHAEAFDNMLVLIPAKFYFPPNSADAGSNMRNGTLKKRKQEQMSTQQRKEGSKKGKRAKLLPGAEKSIIDIQFDKFQSSQGQKTAEGQAAAAEPSEQPAEVSVSNLRLKLQGQLKELSTKRKAKMVDIEQRRVDRKEKKKEQAALAATREGGEGDNRPDSKPKSSTQPTRIDQDDEDDDDDDDEVEDGYADGDGDEDGDEDSGQDDVQFDLVTNTKSVAASEKSGFVPRHKGISKQKALKQALNEEQRLAAVEDPEEKKKMIARKSWDDALTKAQGRKVLSSTKVLQKSIKREEKKKKKSVKNWKDRAQTVTDEKAERQERRKFNIEAHQNKKKDWLNGIKNTKKPGFEGTLTKTKKESKKQKQKKDLSQKSKFKRIKM